MIKILILEDNKERIKQFRARFADMGVPHKIHETDNVDKAIQWVQKERFDVILIDHDLSIEHYGGDFSKSKTGYHFACWLEKNPDLTQQQGLFFTHSLNPEGRKNIVTAISNTGTLCQESPFLWEKEKFKFFFEKRPIFGYSP